MKRTTKRWIILGTLALVVLVMIGYSIFCHFYTVSSIVDVDFEDIQYIRISKYTDPRDEIAELWTTVTNVEDMRALYDAIQNTRLKPPHQPVVFPDGGGWSHVVYVLRDGTEITFGLLSSWNLHYQDTYYEFDDPFTNALRSRYDILADYEVAPLE